MQSKGWRAEEGRMRVTISRVAIVIRAAGDWAKFCNSAAVCESSRRWCGWTAICPRQEGAFAGASNRVQRPRTSGATEVSHILNCTKSGEHHLWRSDLHHAPHSHRGTHTAKLEAANRVQVIQSGCPLPTMAGISSGYILRRYWGG